MALSRQTYTSSSIQIRKASRVEGSRNRSAWNTSIARVLIAASKRFFWVFGHNTLHIHLPWSRARLPDRALPHGACREELTGCNKGKKAQQCREISLTSQKT